MLSLHQATYQLAQLAIRIFRDTDVDSAKATFTAGSSVKAGDLNNNMTQIIICCTRRTESNNISI